MKRLFRFAARWSWDALVFFLPVTSLPLLSKVMGGTDVAPLSAAFLAILVLIWLIPHIIHSRGVPTHSIPLIVFVLLAMVSSLLAFFLPVPSFKSEGLWKNELTNFISLGIGVCFFLVASLWISDEEKLARFFRIVNISGALALLYSLIQVVFIFILKQTPPALANFQDMISSSRTLFVGRINGLTFEPSWLAHQLNMFYIPIWLGLSVKKISFHKFRLARVSLENILLAVSLGVLFLSKSRIGWLAFLAYSAYLILRLMDHFRNSISLKITQKAGKNRSARIWGTLFNIGFWFVLILVLQGILILAGWVLTKVDPRMVQLFDLKAISELGLLGWSSRLVFAERIVYWIAGFQVFVQHPLFGVGLGNSGYFIPQTIGAFGYSLTEILRIFVSNAFLPNPKNLWVRILAETGIAGFSVFVSWLWVEWKTARSNEKMRSPLAQAVGLMGQIVVIGLIVEGFSLDTFALPYYWMTLGLVVAVFRVYSLKVPAEVGNHEQADSLGEPNQAPQGSI